MNLKCANLGSVSTATLKSSDLLDAFHSELEWQIQRNGDFFSLPENFEQRDRLNSILGDAQDLLMGKDGEEENIEDIDYMVNESLIDALQFFAPSYCYFGCHSGDGADFGFWPDNESISDLPNVSNSDEAKELNEDCKFVNNHGNITIYDSNGKVILEIV